MQFISRAFVPALVSFLIGVGVAAYVLPSFALGGLFLVLALAALILWVVRRENIFSLFVVVCAIALALGVFRFTIWAEAPNDPSLEALVGENVVLRGVV